MAPPEEIAASLGDEERVALPVVLAAAQRELAILDHGDPLFGAKEAALVEQLTRSSTAVDPKMDEDKRADWVSVVLEDLLGEPYDLVMEAIPVVRRTTKYHGDILTGIIAYVVPRKARIELERDRYQAIIEATR